VIFTTVGTVTIHDPGIPFENRHKLGLFFFCAPQLSQGIPDRHKKEKGKPDKATVLFAAVYSIPDDGKA
jgi:hypothetical protein